MRSAPPDDPQGIPRLSRPELAARKRAEESLSERLSAMVGSPVKVKLTRNRKRLLSVRVDSRRNRTLRMHSALEEASGEELAVLFREEPSTCRIPLVFYSSNDEDVLRAAVSRFDMLGYISKGSPVHLRMRVAEFLRRSVGLSRSAEPQI